MSLYVSDAAMVRIEGSGQITLRQPTQAGGGGTGSGGGGDPVPVPVGPWDFLALEADVTLGPVPTITTTPGAVVLHRWDAWSFAVNTVGLKQNDAVLSWGGTDANGTEIMASLGNNKHPVYRIVSGRPSILSTSTDYFEYTPPSGSLVFPVCFALAFTDVVGGSCNVLNVNSMYRIQNGPNYTRFGFFGPDLISSHQPASFTVGVVQFLDETTIQVVNADTDGLCETITGNNNLSASLMLADACTLSLNEFRWYEGAVALSTANLEAVFAELVAKWGGGGVVPPLEPVLALGAVPNAIATVPGADTVQRWDAWDLALNNPSLVNTRLSHSTTWPTVDGTRGTLQRYSAYNQSGRSSLRFVDGLPAMQLPLGFEWYTNSSAYASLGVCLALVCTLSVNHSTADEYGLLWTSSSELILSQVVQANGTSKLRVVLGGPSGPTTCEVPLNASIGSHFAVVLQVLDDLTIRLITDSTGGATQDFVNLPNGMADYAPWQSTLSNMSTTGMSFIVGQHNKSILAVHELRIYEGTGMSATDMIGIYGELMTKWGA